MPFVNSYTTSTPFIVLGGQHTRLFHTNSFSNEALVDQDPFFGTCPSAHSDNCLPMFYCPNKPCVRGSAIGDGKCAAPTFGLGTACGDPGTVITKQ